MKENFVNVALVGMFITLLSVTATITWRIATMNALQMAHEQKDAHDKAKEWNNHQEEKITSNAIAATKITLGMKAIATDVKDLEVEIRALKHQQNYNFTRLIRLITKENEPQIPYAPPLYDNGDPG